METFRDLLVIWWLLFRFVSEAVALKLLGYRIRFSYDQSLSLYDIEIRDGWFNQRPLFQLDRRGTKRYLVEVGARKRGSARKRYLRLLASAAFSQSIYSGHSYLIQAVAMDVTNRLNELDPEMEIVSIGSLQPAEKQSV